MVFARMYACAEMPVCFFYEVTEVVGGEVETVDAVGYGWGPGLGGFSGGEIVAQKGFEADEGVLAFSPAGDELAVVEAGAIVE